MSNKKVFIIIIVFVLLISSIGITTFSLGFKDVTNDKWYFNAIHEISNNNIMTGSSKDVFTPNGYVTRAELAQVALNIIAFQDGKIKEEISNILLDANSTVSIEANGWYGSGVIVGDGLVLTAYHVVKHSIDKSCLVMEYGRYTQEIGEIIKFDEQSDLAIIRVKTVYQPIVISDSEISLLDDVYIIGNPLQIKNSFSYGKISNKDIWLSGDSYSLHQIDANVNAGNSGGVVLNVNGELIGIIKSKIDPTQGSGLAFFIKLQEIKKIISEPQGN